MDNYGGSRGLQAPVRGRIYSAFRLGPLFFPRIQSKYNCSAKRWFRMVPSQNLPQSKGESMKTCPRCSTGYPDSHTTCPTHGLPLNEIRDLKPGMVIRNTYRIIRKLGQGGMGAVYLAQHTLMDEPQALKFLSSELSHDEAFTARFLREVRTLRQIRHKNVVDE